MLEYKIKDSQIFIEKNDLTLMDIEAIVYYASHNLQLGSGFGNAIAVRGGNSIQEELKSFGSLAFIQLHHAGGRSPQEIIGQANQPLNKPSIRTNVKFIEK